MFLTFRDWIVGNMGQGGDYAYKGIHLITFGIIILITAFFCYIAGSKRFTDKQKKITLYFVCIFHLSFEIIWRIIFVTVRDMSFRTWWPEFPCNVNGLIIPVIAMTNCKTLKKMFYTFGWVGGILTFLNPEGIFTRNVMTFPILKSVLQHTGLLIIPMFEYFSKKCRVGIKSFLWLLLGMAIIVFHCEVVDRWLGFNGDYLFLRGDLPFVIPGVPQWITMSVSAFIVLLVLTLLANIKETKEFFTKKKN